MTNYTWCSCLLSCTHIANKSVNHQKYLRNLYIFETSFFVDGNSSSSDKQKKGDEGEDKCCYNEVISVGLPF